jgi:hypothetical protein
MFEPLGESDTERTGSNRKTMRIVWVVAGVVVLVLIAVALM